MFIYGSDIEKYQQTGEISIAGFNSSNISGGAYRLRVGTSIQRFTNEQASFDSITMDTLPSISEVIPESGYPLVPGNVYLIQAKESSIGSKFDIVLASTSSAVIRGLYVIGSGMLFDGSAKIAVSVTQPLLIRPNDFFAQVQFHKEHCKEYCECSCAYCPHH